MIAVATYFTGLIYGGLIERLIERLIQPLGADPADHGDCASTSPVGRSECPTDRVNAFQLAVARLGGRLGRNADGILFCVFAF